MSSCESLVLRDIIIGGRRKREHVACGEPGVQYKVRRPHTGALMLPQDKRSYVEIPASPSITQILCNKHKKKAIEMGMECIPIAETPASTT